MGQKRPLIGITPGYNYEEQRVYLNSGYLDAVNKAGGIGIVLPLANELDVIDELIEICDGFLLSGGPDIDAIYYDRDITPYNGIVCPLRDELEICLIKKIFEKRKPMLGICRGIQTLNVAMGGTLYQDIEKQVKVQKPLMHSQKAPKWHPTHNISIENNSKLWDCFKSDFIRVNSFHHQAIKDIAPGFKITSIASDGIIESIEYKEDFFAVGVQWHPECMWQKHPIQLEIFKKFISASEKRR